MTKRSLHSTGRSNWSPASRMRIFISPVVRCYSGKGDLAIAESRRTIELGYPFGQSLLAQSYAAAGRKSEAAAPLKEAIEQSKRSHSGAFFIALAFDALGDKEQTFTWLEESLQGARSNSRISQRMAVPQRRLARRPAFPGSRPPHRDSHAVVERVLVAQTSVCGVPWKLPGLKFVRGVLIT